MSRNSAPPACAIEERSFLVCATAREAISNSLLLKHKRYNHNKKLRVIEILKLLGESEHSPGAVAVWSSREHSQVVTGSQQDS